jgi:hypothetical protein
LILEYIIHLSLFYLELFILFGIINLLLGIAFNIFIDIGSEKRAYLLIILPPIIFQIIISGLIALTTKIFILHNSIESSWICIVLGFLFINIVTWPNTLYFIRNVNNPLEAIRAKGSLFGSLIAFVVYPIIYLFPAIILTIPGFYTLFSWLIEIFNWLNLYWIFRFLGIPLLVILLGPRIWDVMNPKRLVS